MSIRTLRHYDEIGLLPPAEVDPVTGYHLYSAKQLRQLNRIVALFAAAAPGCRLENIVPAVNRARVKFDQLSISGLVKVAGPFMLFYEETDGQEITVNVALPVAEEPAELPPPAHYHVLPAI